MRQPTSQRLRGALIAWRRAVGAKYVRTDKPSRAAVESTTFATTQKVPAIVSPKDRAEVQTCVRIANQYRIPVYPVSRGKNWGYGSRVPDRSGSVILDLSRMSRIIAHSEALAYVTIEPGVSFGQLLDFLRRKKSRLMPPYVGSSPDASIIGNSVERGLGQKTDTAFAESCALEVVLPTGQCIRTGFGRFANATAAQVDRWGVGPSFDGMFTQSNFGIVTEMTIWLPIFPALRDSISVVIDDDAALESLVNALREARLGGVLKSRFLIKSRVRLYAMKHQYPWAAAQERTPLPLAFERHLSRDGFHRWTGMAEMSYCSAAQRAVERDLVIEALGDVPGELSITELDPNWPTPSGMDLPLMYWRKRSMPTGRVDPEADGCGMLLLAPVAPFVGSLLRRVMRAVERIVRTHGFDPISTLRCHTERSVMIILYLVFDRHIEGEDHRAFECWRELFQYMTNNGLFSYRLGIQGMGGLPDPREDYRAFARSLKRTLDPNAILAPGRYEE